jgi:hypothetical protein
VEHLCFGSQFRSASRKAASVTLVTKDERGLFSSSGSKCEELDMSKYGPPSPTERTSIWGAAISLMGARPDTQKHTRCARSAGVGGRLTEAPFRGPRIGYALYRAGARMDAGWPGSFSLGPASLSLPSARRNTCRSFSK